MSLYTSLPLPPLDPRDWMEEVEGELSVDVYETSEAFIVRAPLAGVSREDIDVSITEEQVVISGHRQESIEHSEGWPLVRECYWGRFTRTYRFPSVIDASRAGAKLTDGILTITAPKPRSSSHRSVPIA